MKSWQRFAAWGLILAAGAFWLASALLRPSPSPDGVTPGLPPFPKIQRLLVLAPHCDDETLGSGGVIQSAIQAGIDVHVVIATNGDGYLFATMEEFRRLYPTAQDYIQMGEIRQQESFQALSTLGLQSDSVTFLSYPDRGTPALWDDHWSQDSPYRSPYTGSNRSPYPLTFDSASVYAGEDLLADLMSVLREFRPDLILYPHPDDVHPDHWGLSIFTRLALAEMERADSTYRPAAYAYLVHGPDFPAPRKYLPSQDLLPPTALSRVSPSWYVFDLTPEETAQKWQALQQYRSQLGLLRGLFEGFVRRNELFEQRDPLRLPRLGTGDLSNPTSWRDPDGLPVAPLALDPVKDSIGRDAVPAADLAATFAARTGDDQLLICLEARGNPEPPLEYTLRAIGFSADTSRHVSVTHVRDGKGRFVCAQSSLLDLGSPWLLVLGGEVSGPDVGILDQVAWEVVFP
jgi:LmbE family N-acetylglucosaminyl deacetylase